MSELASQIQARKARLQRFAEAATKYEERKAGERLELQVSMIKAAIASPQPELPKVTRRTYETPNNQLAFTPITWRILRAVSEEFDMPVSEICSAHQESKYTLPRYVAIGLMLQLTNMSYPAIGKRLGGRNHATIINGRERLRALLEGEAFRNRFDQIKASIIA
jgi:hypothetical protein